MPITGPIPKRSEERAGHNTVIPTEKVNVEGPVVVPELGISDPHPLVEEFWEALKASGQSKYYEPSDWVYAKFTLHMINQGLNTGRLGAAHLQQYNVMLANLLVSEGERRRARLEIERRPDGLGDGKVLSASERFKARFSGPVSKAQ